MSRAGLALALATALGACAGPRERPTPAGPPVLLLPLEARGGLATAPRAAAERALGAAVRGAGREPARWSQPSCATPPCPELRPPLGDEPDARLAAEAASAGVPAVLAGWAAPLPDGSYAWALRLVEAPPAEPEANAGAPAGAAPDAAAPAPSPARPTAFRTVDRAGGQARSVQTLARAIGHAAAGLLAGPPAPSPRGQRTVGDLARHLRARSGLFDACFAERLLARPELAGVAVVQIAVGSRGEVRDARVASTFGDPGLEACLADAAAQVDFPAGVGGTSVIEQRLVWPVPSAVGAGDRHGAHPGC